MCDQGKEICRTSWSWMRTSHRNTHICELCISSHLVNLFLHTNMKDGGRKRRRQTKLSACSGSKSRRPLPRAVWRPDQGRNMETERKKKNVVMRPYNNFLFMLSRHATIYRVMINRDINWWKEWIGIIRRRNFLLCTSCNCIVYTAGMHATSP